MNPNESARKLFSAGLVNTELPEGANVSLAGSFPIEPC